MAYEGTTTVLYLPRLGNEGEPIFGREDGRVMPAVKFGNLPRSPLFSGYGIALLNYHFILRPTFASSV